VTRTRLRIVVYPETQRTWTARAIEHDLCVEGRSIQSAIDALLKIALAHVAYDQRHDHEPLSSFAAAPRLYWTAFHAATALPITLEVAWSKDGEPGRIVAALLRQHPAVQPAAPISRTA
jgi:hypothetical protein